MSSGAMVQVVGLRDLLNRCQRLIRVHAVFRGFAETLCVLIAGVVLACLLDYFTALPGVVRFALLAFTTLISGIVAWKRLIRPVVRRVPDEELGAVVDLQFPELQESLATLISIEEPTASAGEAGSLLMRQRLEQHVQSQIRRVQPSAVVKSKTTIKRCGLALLSVIALLIPLLVWPSGSRLLMQRFLMPFANLAAPTNLFFEVPNGNRIVATNTDVQFVAIPQWRTGISGELPTNVVVEMQVASRGIEDLPMMFDEAKSEYSVMLADVRDSLRYRVRGGGAASEWFELTVADPPRILSAVLQETPPVYTGRPVETFDGIVGDIPVFERSQIEMSLTFNKPVKSVRIEWKNWKPIDVSSAPPEEQHFGGDQDLLPEEIAAGALAPVQPQASEPPSDPPVLSPDRTAAVFRFEALGSGQFEFLVEDDPGLTNSNETDRRLVVTIDTPPTLTVTGIADGLELRPGDVVPLNCVAADDLGVGLLEMHFRKNNDAVRIQPAVPLDRGALTVAHDFLFDLTTLDANAGDTVTFRVRAADERPMPGPQVVWKGPWTVRITDDAEPLGQQALREADQRLVNSLRELEEQLRQDTEKANELKKQADNQWNEKTQQDVRALSEKEQKQGRELQSIAEQVAEHPLMQKQSEKLTELAQKIRQDVPAKLDEAAGSDREEAARSLQDSAIDLSDVREQLREAADEIEKLAQLEQELAELNRLALEAEQLSRDAQELQQQRAANQPEEGQSPQEHQEQLDRKQQQLQQEQKELNKDLGDLLQRQQDLLQSAREAQMDKAADVAEQAQRLAQQQQQLAEGVNEEARDAARDSRELADELQKSRNEAEQLGQEIQQQAQDVPRPEVKPLDEAISDLRQGNLASPQQDIEKAQQQLTETAEKLAHPAEAQPADPNADPQDANTRREAEQKLAEQNQNRKELGEKAEKINERLEQLQGQLAEMATELGGKPEQQDAAANPENTKADNTEGAQANSGEKGATPQADNANPQDAGGQQPGEQPPQARNPQDGAPPQNGNEGNPSKEQPGAADVSRNMLDQLEQVRQTAREQAEAVNADPAANEGAKNHSEQAADRADDAMRHAQAGQFNRAAERMRNAASESADASNSLNEESQQDRKAQLEQQGESFNRMSDTLQQLQRDDATQVATQQEAQRNVAEAAEGLEEPLNELAESLDLPALGMQHLARPAQQAAAAAQEAARTGNEAAEQLDQAQLQQAGEAAQETAGNLNRAAQLAQQAAQGYREPNPQIPSEVGESVTDALQSLQRAEQMMNQEAPQPGEGQPGEGQPGEGQPGEGQPGEGQPGEGQPGEGQPGEGQPGEGQPGEGQPGEGQPGEGQPGEGQPGEGQPGEGQPGEGQPGEGQGKGSSSQQLSNAAKALQKAAKGALPNAFSPGQLGSEGPPSAGDPGAKGNTAQFDGKNPDATGRKGTARKWGQLQDELDSNIGDAGKEVLDSEYSELIRRYRRDLARSTDKDAAKKSGPKK